MRARYALHRPSPSVQTRNANRAHSLRRRVLTAAGALTLIAFSVFSGAMSASAVVPAQPVMLSPSANAIQFAPGLFADGTIAATNVAVYVEVRSYNPDTGVTDVPCFDLLVAFETTWSCAGILQPGVNQLTAIAYDANNPADMSTPSPMVEIIKASTLPDGDISSPYNGEATSDQTPAFSGSGPTMGFVDVIVDGTIVCDDVAVGYDALWSCTPINDIAFGSYTDVHVTSTYANSTPGPDSANRSLFIRPVKPALSFSFSAAQAQVTGIGDAAGGVGIELYSATPDSGGYQFDLVDGCPTPVATPDPFDDDMVYGASTETCTFSGLTPGIWNIYSGQQVAAGTSDKVNDFFRIPSTPTIQAKLNPDRSVTLSGTNASGNIVFAQTAAHATVCEVATVGTTWSCTISPSLGMHRYVAFSRDQGFVADTGEGQPADASYQGISAYSGEAAVRVTGIIPTTTVPTVTTTLDEWTFNLSGDGEYEPGDTVTITGTNAPAGAVVDFELHSTPMPLGSIVTDLDGSFRASVTIPADAEPGEHHIVAILTPADGTAPTQVDEPISVVQPVPVADAQTPVVPSRTAVVDVRQQPGAPSAIEAGLITPLELISNPVVVATAGSIGLALVLLVFVPAEFFGEALAGHYATLAGAIGRRRGVGEFVNRVGQWIASHRVVTSVILVLATSAVFSFVDPNFGPDLTSLRLVMSCAISILLVNFASAGITELIANRAWSIATRLTVMPWGLLAAILGVIASRVLNFAPGFLLGSIIGVSIVGEISKRLEARVVVLWSTVVWSIAVGAWVLGGLVPSLPIDHPMAFVTALAGDALAATTAAGLTALVVALLPIKLFDGGELFAYSRVRWAIAFGIAVLSFSFVIVPSAGNWLELGEGLRNWLLLTVGFIVLAVIVYLLARRSMRDRRSKLMGGHVS